MAKLSGVCCILVCVLTVVLLATIGQARNPDVGGANPAVQAPSAPAQPYVVMTGQAVSDTVRDLQSGNKTQNLLNAGGVGCRVFIQHEKDVSTSQAEVHDGADDVFIVMEGTTTLTLGGKLDSPNQVQPGEWRAGGIAGGKEFKLSKGDVVIVPRGTPHQRISASQDVTLMVVKSFTPAGK